MKGRLLAIAVIGIPGLLLCLLAFNSIKDARPAEPVAITGMITSFGRAYPGCGKCFHTLLPYDWDANKVSLQTTDAGSSGPFWLHTGEFHPSLPDALKHPGARATIWYDRGTSDLIGLVVGGHRYATEYLDHPRTKYWDVIGLGIVVALPGALALLLALLLVAVPVVRAIGPPRHFHPRASADTRTSDDEAEAYGYVALFFYGVTAFLGFIVASVRWGSMPFWGLVIGGVLSSGIAISEAPLIDRLEATTKTDLGWIPKVKLDLSLLSLVVFPIGTAVILTIALTFVERQL